MPADAILPPLVFWMNYPSHYQNMFFNALREKGNVVHVIYYEHVPRQRVELGWSTEAADSLGRSVNGVCEALSVLTEFRSGIHIIPGYGGNLLPWVVLAAALRGLRWLHWSEPAHPGIRWWLSWPRKRLYAQMVDSFALGALAIGENARADFLRWGMTGERIHILPYSRDGGTGVERNHHASLDEIVFGFVGAICVRKGIDCLLAAFRIIAPKFPHARLLFVGRNEMGALLSELIDACPCRDRINVRPAVPAAQVYATLAGMDVFVMPSRFDGWGVALHEAAWAGCALISSPTCGAAMHLVEECASGRLVPAGQVAPLASAMADYAAEPEMARRHGLCARRLASEFSTEANACRLKSIMHGIGQGGTGTESKP